MPQAANPVKGIRQRREDARHRSHSSHSGNRNIHRQQNQSQGSLHSHISRIKGRYTQPERIGGNIVKAGSAVITVTAEETGEYAQTAKDVNVTVNKAAPSVTAPTPRALTYDTYAHDLVDAGSTGDGTLYYAVTTEDTARRM